MTVLTKQLINKIINIQLNGGDKIKITHCLLFPWLVLLVALYKKEHSFSYMLRTKLYIQNFTIQITLDTVYHHQLYRQMYTKYITLTGHLRIFTTVMYTYIYTGKSTVISTLGTSFVHTTWIYKSVCYFLNYF